MLSFAFSWDITRAHRRLLITSKAKLGSLNRYHKSASKWAQKPDLKPQQVLPHTLPSHRYFLQQSHKITVNKQATGKTHLWVCWARHWEDSWTRHVLDSVSNILGITGNVSLKGGVGVEALRVCVRHRRSCHCVLLVHGWPHRDHWHDRCCCSHCSCYCYSGRLSGHPVVCQPSCCFGGSPCTAGAAARGAFSLGRGPTDSLFIQPVPLVRYFKEDFWVHATSLRCLFYCHAGLFQHQIVLRVVRKKQNQRWSEECKPRNRGQNYKQREVQGTLKWLMLRGAARSQLCSRITSAIY